MTPEQIQKLIKTLESNNQVIRLLVDEVDIAENSVANNQIEINNRQIAELKMTLAIEHNIFI